MKLYKVLLSEQDIRELIQKYGASLKRNNITRQERYKSMIFVRLADLGFDKEHIRRMIIDLTDIDTEKDVDVFMSRYRLWGDDYAAIISNSTIGNNYAPSGGGIKVAQRMKANGAVLLTNTQIVGNSSEGYAVTGSDCFIIFNNVDHLFHL